MGKNKKSDKKKKYATKAAKHAAFAARVQAALDELSLANGGLPAAAGAGSADPDELLSRLDATLESALRHTEQINGMRTSIEDLAHAFAEHGDHVRTCRIELDNAHHQTLARISAVEHDVERRAARLTKAMADEVEEQRAQIEQHRAQTAERWEQAQAAALELVERAVQETGDQARAALHRSTDRIGTLLAAVEARAVGFLDSPQGADVLEGADVLAAGAQAELGTTGIDARDFAGFPDVAANGNIEVSAAPEFRSHALGPLVAEFGFGEPFDADIDGNPHYEDCAPLSWPTETAPAPEPGELPWPPTMSWTAPEPVSEPTSDGIEGAGEDEAAGMDPGAESIDDGGDPDDTRPPPPRNGRVVTVASAPPVAAAEATVTVQVSRLVEAVDTLTRQDGAPIRAEIVQRIEEGTPRAVLRLTALDPEGWWDIRDVPARTRAVGVAPVVVSSREIVDILGGITRFEELQEVDLTFDDTLTIDGRQVDTQGLHLVPAPPESTGPVERVNLRTARESGLAIETTDGWIAITPGLVAHLRADELTEVEVTISDANPVMTARRVDPKDRCSARCVAMLPRSEDEYPDLDRRNAGGNATEQLLAVLSTHTTSDELERMLKVGVNYVRRRAAAHPMLAPDLITTILESSDDAMRAAAASNPSLGVDACHAAAADHSMEVRAAAAANRALPATLLSRLATDSAAHVRLGAARNPHADPEILTKLAHDEDPEVRLAVASRTGADAEVLRALSVDADSLVCAAVAANPSCPADLLEALVSIAPLEVLSNPQAPETLLAAASLLDTADFRAAVASNPATPTAVLTRLARDHDDEVLRAVAVHPGIPSRLRKSAQRRLPRD